MTSQQEFGGEWTQDKLTRLKGYLNAYMTILKRHPYFQTIYVDAFAGTGQVKTRPTEDSSPRLFNEGDYPEVNDVVDLLKGSTRVALEVVPPFGKYIFIERSTKKYRELVSLKTEYANLSGRIEIHKADATVFLKNFCQTTNWNQTRAVVFLDPFGMQVEWSLLETIANTKAIDLWLLVPLGMGANRLMTRRDLPQQIWSDRLTAFFGTDDWKTKHYKVSDQGDLFGEPSAMEKDTDHERLVAYFIGRLQQIFPGVANNPLVQRNSHNSPMFSLCFATSNPKPTVRDAALKIAQHLLRT